VRGWVMGMILFDTKDRCRALSKHRARPECSNPGQIRGRVRTPGGSARLFSEKVGTKGMAW
jgi:hypothetical protein